MSLINCGECGHQVSTLAAACPNCGAPPTSHLLPADNNTNDAEYVSNPETTLSVIWRYATNFIGLIIWLVAFLIIVGLIHSAYTAYKDGSMQSFFQDLGQQASGQACEVIEVQAKEDFFLTNGEADFGYTVSVHIRKISSAGDVLINAALSSTEGELNKSRTVRMDEGQASIISLQFSEPTINAGQVQVRASCST